jgi:predicted permease
MSNIWLEVRFALRQLRKSPGFTLTAVLTLAFGIGATTAIFSIVEGVLLRALPFPDQDQLLCFGDVPAGDSLGGDPGTTAPAARIYTREMKAFSSLGAYQPFNYEFSGQGEPAKIKAARLTASIFTALGVSPMMGRTFTEQEDEGSRQVAVVSYQTWRSRFQGDPRILGTRILLDRKTYEIVGIMPRGFEFPPEPGKVSRCELWVPMSFTPAELGSPATWGFGMMGRLKPGVTLAQALEDAKPAVDEINHNFPADLSMHVHAVASPLTEVEVGEVRPMVQTLFLAVTVVLLIACANLAGLLLVRVIRQRHEISVRMALGASAASVVRQSLTEALLLSGTGGLLGLALAAILLRMGPSLLPESLPRMNSIVLDWQVAGFALLLAVLTGIACGLVPALVAARTNINDVLKEGGRTGTAAGSQALLRSIVVVLELAVALVLLNASGLLLRSFWNMRSVHLGFRADHVLTASYALPREQYSSQAAVDAFDMELLRKLEQLPGVEAAGIASMLPEGKSDARKGFVPEGYVPQKGAGINLAWSPTVIGHYLSAIGTPLLRGRDFTEADRDGSPLVAIVNHTLAERYWPGQDPIGKHIKAGLTDSKTPWMTVVGETADVRQKSADVATANQMYRPASQYKASIASLAPPDLLTGVYGSIVLRSQTPPEKMVDSLRAVMRSIDPQLPLANVEPMEQVVQESQASRRFSTALVSSFAGAAVLLALLGIYSVIAFSAAMRTQEMAIRLALGAQRANVIRLVLFSGARLGLVGSGIGGVAAVFATRLLRSMLFQVDPFDPFILTLAAASIFLIALAASVVPARRAAAIEPMQALRTE